MGEFNYTKVNECIKNELNFIPNVAFVTGENKDKIDYKITSDLEGGIMPVNIEALEDLAHAIAKRIYKDNINIDFIIGFAGRGIIPAFVLSRVLKVPLQIGYKNRLLLNNEIIIKEEHSKNKNIYVYLDEKFKDKNICFVDDEISSGRTFINAYNKLKKAGYYVIASVAFIENTSRKGREALKIEGLPLYSAVKVKNMKEEYYDDAKNK